MSSYFLCNFVSFSPPYTVQIDPLDDHDQLFVRECKPFGRIDRIRRRRLESARFKTFVQYPKPVPIEHEYLHLVPSFVHEDKGAVPNRVPFQMQRYQSRQPVEIFPHVRRMRKKINPRRKNNPKHQASTPLTISVICVGEYIPRIMTIELVVCGGFGNDTGINPGTETLNGFEVRLFL